MRLIGVKVPQPLSGLPGTDPVGAGMAEMFLDIPLVELGRTGKTGAQAVAGEQGETVLFR